MKRPGDTLPPEVRAALEAHPTPGTKPLYLVWLRHFGCRFYQEARLLLPELHQALAAGGIDLVCFVQGTDEEVAVYWPFPEIPVVGDPHRRTYRAMGWDRTTLVSILLPSRDLKRRRTQANAQGCSVDKKAMASASSDVLQLPGAALVRDGTVLWVHGARHTGDLDLTVAAAAQARQVLAQAGDR